MGRGAKEVFETIIALEAAKLERPLRPVRRQFYCDLAISIARNAALAILERLPEPDVNSHFLKVPEGFAVETHLT